MKGGHTAPRNENILNVVAVVRVTSMKGGHTAPRNLSSPPQSPLLPETSMKGGHTAPRNANPYTPYAETRQHLNEGGAYRPPKRHQ